ncbi:MAG: helix-turn-helix domain-containing protein [Methylococcaceae bacterium]
MLANNSQSQRNRLLEHPRQHRRITTLEARAKLDVLHPAARIQELRGQGNNIITYRRMVNTGMGNHTIAEYVLLSS